jgi:hypothetical protein
MLSLAMIGSLLNGRTAANVAKRNTEFVPQRSDYMSSCLCTRIKAKRFTELDWDVSFVVPIDGTKFAVVFLRAVRSDNNSATKVMS